MNESDRSQLRNRRRSATVALAVTAAGAVLLAACGSSGTKKTTSAAPTTTAAASPSSSPGTAFSTANVPGLGTVLVDGTGKTVYLLTSGDHTNVPCDDASGCTKVWPDLPLPDGTSAAKAGMGVQASLLGTMKLSDGETYPTYGGWLMYEFSKDTGPGEGHGQGIKSFGGTWYAITPAGDPVTAGSAPAATTASTMPAASSNGGGGY